MINKIAIILLVVIVLVFIVKIDKEHFIHIKHDDTAPMKERELMSIIPSVEELTNSSGQTIYTYIAAFRPENSDFTDKNVDKYANNNLISTSSLKQDIWHYPIKNSAPAPNAFPKSPGQVQPPSAIICPFNP